MTEPQLEPDLVMRLSEHSAARLASKIAAALSREPGITVTPTKPVGPLRRTPGFKVSTPCFEAYLADYRLKQMPGRLPDPPDMFDIRFTSWADGLRPTADDYRHGTVDSVALLVARDTDYQTHVGTALDVVRGAAPSLETVLSWLDSDDFVNSGVHFAAYKKDEIYVYIAPEIFIIQGEREVVIQYEDVLGVTTAYFQKGTPTSKFAIVSRDQLYRRLCPRLVSRA